MKYDYDGLTENLRKFLNGMNKSALDFLNLNGVEFLTKRMFKKELSAMKHKSNSSKSVIMQKQYYNQIIARNLLKLHHEIHKSTNLQAGYVYIISNPAWPGWYKIGCSIDVNDRTSVYQTSSPFRDYKLEFYVFTFNRTIDERKVINKFNGDSEWVNAPLSDIKEFCKELSPYYKSMRHIR